jgi:hypothetical protein
LFSHGLVHSLLNVRLGTSRLAARSSRSDLGLVVFIILIFVVTTLPLASLLVLAGIGSATSTNLAGRLSQTETFGKMTEV